MFEVYRFPTHFMPFWHLAARMGVQPVCRFLDEMRRGGATTLLDVASGAGANALFAARRGFRVTAVDLAAAGLIETRDVAAEIDTQGSIQYLAGDCTVLAVRDTCFDVVVASHVIEHLKDPAAMFREIDRVLKPGGHVWLSCPTRRQGLRLMRALGFDPDPHDHEVPGYDVEDVRALLPASMRIKRTLHQARPIQTNLIDLQQLAARAMGMGANPSAPETESTPAQPRSSGAAIRVAYAIKEIPLLAMIALSKIEDAIFRSAQGSMMSVVIKKSAD